MVAKQLALVSPDQAAFRIDFGEWLANLGRRDRLMIEQLAAGERTIVAKRLKVTPAAVSQHRVKWRSSWLAFIGEAVGA